MQAPDDPGADPLLEEPATAMEDLPPVTRWFDAADGAPDAPPLCAHGRTTAGIYFVVHGDPSDRARARALLLQGVAASADANAYPAARGATSGGGSGMKLRPRSPSLALEVPAARARRARRGRVVRRRRGRRPRG